MNQNDMLIANPCGGPAIRCVHVTFSRICFSGTPGPCQNSNPTHPARISQ
jgi:hypothetical protein